MPVTVRGTRQPGSQIGLYKINFDQYYSLQDAPVVLGIIGHYGGFLTQLWQPAIAQDQRRCHACFSAEVKASSY